MVFSLSLRSFLELRVFKEELFEFSAKIKDFLRLASINPSTKDQPFQWRSDSLQPALPYFSQREYLELKYPEIKGTVC